jgi:hypothetical protein
VVKPRGRNGAGSTWWYAISEASLDDAGVSYCGEHKERGEAEAGEGADELEEGLANSDNSVEGGRAHPLPESIASPSA